MAIPTSRIVELAQIIASQTSTIDKHIQEHNLPQPSFNEDAPFGIDKATSEVEKAKTDVVEASIELRQLLQGPMGCLLPESNFSPLVTIYRYKIANHVPFNSSISFAELASKTNLLEHDLRRIIRFAAIHHRVFHEPKIGFVAHTAASKLLANSEKIGDVMGLVFDECWPAHSKMPEAVALRSQEPHETGFSLANNTQLGLFEFFSHHPERAQRFASAMSSTSEASLQALASYFDWGSLPKGSTVVDIGGSQGHVSRYLADKYQNLRFIVQDLEEVIEGAAEKLKTQSNSQEDSKPRISFLTHDMFTPQPVKHADVYLFRYVLHDWSDKYCVNVLRQLIPALKVGAKVVIQDHLLPEPGSLGLLQEMQLRSMDAIMLSLFNSRERDEGDWKGLFEQSDGRFAGFEARRIKQNPSTGVMVAEWTE